MLDNGRLACWNHGRCVLSDLRFDLSACSVVRRRLNWQLHFGEPPKWAAGVRFVLVDPEPSERDVGIAAVSLRGEALMLDPCRCPTDPELRFL